MPIQIPRGTRDVLPKDIPVWRLMEETARDVCRLYNYSEIRTPMFESTDLFQRGVGETTDIVQKEMYTFLDRAGRSLTLRPEGTAPVVRSFIENKMHGLPDQPVKLFYMGPMFRYERPQAGRTRQFTQFGVEAIGSDDPNLDAEVIALALTFYKRIGLKRLKLVINSLGDPESRKDYKKALIAHFQPAIHEFCEDCQNRLERNPLRILDCKVDREHVLMASAPSILDYLNEPSRAFFEKVKAALDRMGIEYEVDPTLVRGLDYYHHTTFEIMGADFGAITTLCGGGRYGGLVEEFGGPKVPGIGFGLSFERVLLAMEAEGIAMEESPSLDCFVVAIGEAAEDRAAEILQDLRSAGLSADKDYMGRKPKGQFKQADRYGARFVAVLGDDELARGVINVKNMATGNQEEVSITQLPDYLKTNTEV
ncbi:histidine--tRNA ligase [Caenibacillus caldisaponilyticus]|uniref:histidine--tRNA ligase n=1 Tax=Caenibacillus caldisaponilyticus TaxID=1674942 RepID=UPI0009884FFB|nr:histidine--tRNA ligase [Caenibacillus caldisaponilyticus]